MSSSDVNANRKTWQHQNSEPDQTPERAKYPPTEVLRERRKTNEEEYGHRTSVDNPEIPRGQQKGNRAADTEGADHHEHRETSGGEGKEATIFEDVSGPGR